MSRHGYSDDCEDYLAAGRWSAQVKSAIRGRRGQAFLKELAAAMDAMPVKELIAEQLIDEEGQCCTIGVVCKARGIDVSKVDPEEPEQVGATVGIARQMAAEIEYENDENHSGWRQVPCDKPPESQWHPGWRWVRVEETPSERWQRMRKWVESQIKPTPAIVSDQVPK